MNFVSYLLKLTLIFTLCLFLYVPISYCAFFPCASFPLWLFPTVPLSRGTNPTPNSDLAVSIKLLCHKVLTPQILRPTRFPLSLRPRIRSSKAREEMHTRERQLRSKVSWKTKGNLDRVRLENGCDNDIDQGDTSAGGIPLQHGKLCSRTKAFHGTGDWHTNGAGRALMMKSKNLRGVY